MIYAAVLLATWVFCVLQVIAVRRFLAVRPPALDTPEPVSILKPLHGVDEGLEENLRSFFEQDYPSLEILFAARTAEDACWGVVDKLAAEYAHVPVQRIVTGEPPYPNAKVFSLARMSEAAAYDLLIMSDSDIRVTPSMTRVLAAEFQDPHLAVATCPYRAVPGRSLWSTLEAIGMNTEFWGGALTARLVERGVHFAVGPTIAARRKVIASLGGFDRFSRYLAEDFVMGQFASEAGHGVILSSYVIEHRIGSQAWGANFAHRLRWSRSTRRSRPAGYLGQFFTYTLPLALLASAVRPSLWPLLAVTLLARAAAAYAVSQSVLRDPLCRHRWYWVPVQDVLSFAFWIAGFFGNTILWRGRRYRLHSDGTFTLLS